MAVEKAIFGTDRPQKVLSGMLTNVYVKLFAINEHLRFVLHAFLICECVFFATGYVQQLVVTYFMI